MKIKSGCGLEKWIIPTSRFPKNDIMHLAPDINTERALTAYILNGAYIMLTRQKIKPIASIKGRSGAIIRFAGIAQRDISPKNNETRGVVRSCADILMQTMDRTYLIIFEIHLSDDLINSGVSNFSNGEEIINIPAVAKKDRRKLELKAI